MPPLKLQLYHLLRVLRPQQPIRLLHLHRPPSPPSQTKRRRRPLQIQPESYQFMRLEMLLQQRYVPRKVLLPHLTDPLILLDQLLLFA